ncbi:tudor domain-containing protein 1 [Engraulis encrasicolus]|uniref:tudor domain-containing protein 1 n=1 Tax=Engraulis encrasicolus TaxID=184585 RepID=UPI002FD4A083
MNNTMLSPGAAPPPYRPLRRPVPRPGMLSPCGPVSASLEQASLPAPEQPEAKGLAGKPVSTKDLSQPMQITILGSAAVKLCNFCGQEGQVRCSDCKRTVYCSEACQANDKPAHRHTCGKEPEHSSEKPKETPTMPAAAPGVGMPEPKSQVDGRNAAQSKRVYFQDLVKVDIPQGAEIQAVGVDIQSPSRFFMSIHSSAVEESLRKISMGLQQACGAAATGPYTPEAGEVCAVKFSQDQQWYRGLAQTVSGEQQAARVLYIDFGNEEDVPFDRIKPFPDSVDRSAPNALQCRVAGVAPVTGGWKEECSLFLKQLLYGKSVAVQVQAVTVDSGRSLYAVDMNLAPTGIEMALGAFLVEHGHAVKDVTPTPTPTTEQDIGKTYSMLNDSVEKVLCQSQDATTSMAAPQHPAQLLQEVGEAFTGVASCMLSPIEVVCQVAENCQTVQELQVKLNEYCSATKPTDCFKPAPGTICCALYSEDNQWYRAKVVKVSSEGRASVRFIDYGNVEEVDLGRLMPIAPELLALPAQGIPCTLAGIRAPEGGWSEQVALMSKSLLFGRYLAVTVLGRGADGVLVAVTDAQTNDPQSNVANTLVSMGLAVAEPVAESKTQAPAEAAPAQPQAQPPPPAQPQTAQPSTAAAPPPPASSTPAPPKLEWTCAELPQDGQPTPMVISIIENPGEFYCHRYLQQDMQALMELSAELVKHCQGGASPVSPVVGEPCCALFTDGSWYRALVQGVGADGKVQVYFVDYGNSSSVDASQLRSIEQRLLTLPFLAIRCWLAGAAPVGGQWSASATKRMKELGECRFLTGRVVSVTGRGYGVELQSDDHNIATTLINDQLALEPSPANKPTIQQQPAAVPNQNQAPVQVAVPTPNRSQDTTPLPAASTNQSQPAAPRPAVGSNKTLAANLTNTGSTTLIPPPVARPIATEANQSQGPATATSQPQSTVTNKNTAADARPPATTNHRAAPVMAMSPSTASQPSAAGFPLDWKTEELPLQQPFVPQVAAATSPALFYLLSSSEVNGGKIQQLLIEVDKYCRQAAPSQTSPTPGAACCAQFSGDKKWYRAVVLDVSGPRVSVIYADFGNAEVVPLSHVLPIPPELLQLPFRTVRCALTGKEQFPSVWPDSALEVFETLLCGPLQAVALGFSGGCNILDLTHQAHGEVAPLVMKSLQQGSASTAGTPTPGPPPVASEQSKTAVPAQQQQAQKQQQQQPQPPPSSTSTSATSTSNTAQAGAALSKTPLLATPAPAPAHDQVKAPDVASAKQAAPVTAPNALNFRADELLHKMDKLEQLMMSLMQRLG